MELFSEVATKFIGLLLKPFYGLLVHDGFDVRQFAIECFFDRAHFIRKLCVLVFHHRTSGRGQIWTVEEYWTIDIILVWLSLPHHHVGIFIYSKVGRKGTLIILAAHCLLCSSLTIFGNKRRLDQWWCSILFLRWEASNFSLLWTNLPAKQLCMSHLKVCWKLSVEVSENAAIDSTFTNTARSIKNTATITFFQWDFKFRSSYIVVFIAGHTLIVFFYLFNDGWVWCAS